MRIRKEYQAIPTNALLENGDSISATNGYTAEYINNHSVVVSPTEPSGSARKKVWKQHGTNVNDKEYVLNNNVYEEFMPKNETETIRNNAGLVLKRNGNVINFYTTKYIANGTLEGYTIPEEYRPKEVLQVSCMAYFPGTYWQPRHIGNKTTSLGNFQVEVADGHQDTSYVYVSFNLVWFI